MSTPDDSLESLRKAFASLSEDVQPGPGCPLAERLWQAARSELPPEDARPLVQHTVECPACAEAWRLAQGLSPLAPPMPEAPPARRWSGGWLSLAAAAAVVITAILAVPLGPRRSPEYRAGEGEGIRSLVPETRPLPRDQIVLRWSALADARYDVRVTTEDLAAVAEALGLAAPEYLVPPAALAGLPSGTRLLWQVEAVSPGGARRRSPTFLVRLE